MVEFALSVGIANEAMNVINLGDEIETEIDSVLLKAKVIAKHGAYALIIQGKTNQILCPVNWTTIYKEIEMRMPSDTVATGPKKRGRPPKGEAATGPQAPTGQPVRPIQADSPPPGGWLPPGAPDPASAAPTAPAWAQPAGQPATVPTAHTKAVAQEGDASAWIAETIDNALQQLRSDILQMATTLLEDLPEPEAAPAPEPPPRIMTCGDCQHVNFPQDKCDHWNMKPPIKVIINAQKECPAFLPDEIMNDEIPF